MGAKVTIKVELPNGKPVPGAAITGTNHDAWSSKHSVWKASTNQEGLYEFADLDTGTLGDRYTFDVVSRDVAGGTWVGSASQRVSRPLTLTITLQKEPSPAGQP